jgi:two-component system, chemotaxis family, protein-glutamate methylesterase/glutaminase
MLTSSSSSKIKVLIVDDSTVVRQFLAKAVAAESDLEVIGTAKNGQEALELLKKCTPDIMTLDVEMPVMDGLTTLANVRKTNKTLPIIMFSTLTERGASVTVEALVKGATDYIAKPSSLGGGKDKNFEEISGELCKKIRMHLAGKLASSAKPSLQTFRGATAGQSQIQSKFKNVSSRTGFNALCIAVSTGGPGAMVELFKKLPKMDIPIFITQHMPPLFTKMFAVQLNTYSPYTITEAQDGEIVQNGHAYVAPGDYHMTVVKEGLHCKIKLNQDALENSCRPAADVMFRSLAQIYGKELLGLVLTGMGSDGAKGAKVICDAGGEVIVQDQATSAVWGMPGAVVALGCATEELPLLQIPEVVYRKVTKK